MAEGLPTRDRLLVFEAKERDKELLYALVIATVM